MDQFIKSSTNDYKNDELYIKANELIGISNSKVIGSYIKYGKDKVCDMDLQEETNSDNLNDYLKKIYEKRKEYKLITAYFNEPYKKLKIIQDKLGYLDGTFIKHSKASIQEDINNLPDELKKPLQELIGDYIKTQDINIFIKILLFIKRNLYPKWTLKELLNGEKEYYGEIFKIDNNYDYFYIEIIYKGFRISNYITFRDTITKNDYLIFEIEDLIYNDELSYYRLLKKFLVFIKWLFFKKQDEELKNNAVKIHNQIYKFIDNYGGEYNEICLIKNKIDIYKLKLNKYQTKENKHKKQYEKHIIKYNKLIDKLEKEYSKRMKTISNEAKKEYLPLLEKYKLYFENYYRIY